MAESNMPITEFQSRNEDAISKTPGSEPTSEEEKIIQMVNNTFNKYKKKRGLYDSFWLDFYKFFRGVQWLHARPSYRHSEVFNLIFQHIQSQVPIITDTRPRITYIPREPGNLRFAELMNKVYQADWDSNNWLFKTTEVIYDSHIYGIGYSSLTYDEDANFGAGQIVYKSEDPFYVFPHPEAKDINEENEGLLIAKPVDVFQARRDHPKQSLKIEADMIDIMGGHRSELGHIRFRSPVNTRTINVEGHHPHDHRELDKALEITAYLKPGDVIEDATQDDKTGKRKFVQRLKWPNGRTVKITGGAVVQNDDSLPFDDLKFPFSRLINYILPREFYGISEVENLMSPQVVFNKLISFILDVLTIMGNPIWVVDTASGIDPETIFNRPGLILEKEPGTEVRREEGVHLQPYVTQIIDRVKTWYDQLGGSTDVTRGIQPGNVTAASAIENLQDSAQTRIRQKMRNLDAYLTDVGRQYVSRVMEFYTAPRVFRLTRDDGSMEFFRFNVESEEVADEDGNKRKVNFAVVSSFDKDEDGNLTEGEPDRFQIQGELDVKATTGTGLPFAKAEKEQRLLQLFDRGIIDEQEVLEQTDFPNADRVLERVARKKEAEAQAAAAAQGQ